eukprot:TRINITY_DN1969_c0_g1_i1.p1 TRINITY_DN1969_c0_g1~~TRINITY_DN1969_c0_g1_i1.p1  ORF type:complete len:631 (+),score=205.01 TRINITY_DN1969_c0_g1_i1:79-1971(+)
MNFQNELLKAKREAAEAMDMFVEAREENLRLANVINEREEMFYKDLRKLQHAKKEFDSIKKEIFEASKKLQNENKQQKITIKEQEKKIEYLNKRLNNQIDSFKKKDPSNNSQVQFEKEEQDHLVLKYKNREKRLYEKLEKSEDDFHMLQSQYNSLLKQFEDFKVSQDSQYQNYEEKINDYQFKKGELTTHFENIVNEKDKELQEIFEEKEEILREFDAFKGQTAFRNQELAKNFQHLQKKFHNLLEFFQDLSVKQNIHNESVSQLNDVFFNLEQALFAENGQLNIDLNSMIRHIKFIEEENLESQKIIDNLQTVIQLRSFDLESMKEASENQNNQWNDEKQAFEAKILLIQTNYGQDIELLQSQLVEIESELKKKEKCYLQMEKRYLDASKRVEQLQSEKDTIQTKSLSLQEQCSATQVKLSKIETSTHELNEEIYDLRDTNLKLQSNVKELESRYGELMDSYNEVNKKSTESLDKNNMLLKVWEKRAKDAENLVDQNMKMISNSQDVVRKLRNENNDLRMKLRNSRGMNLMTVDDAYQKVKENPISNANDKNPSYTSKPVSMINDFALSTIKELDVIGTDEFKMDSNSTEPLETKKRDYQQKTSSLLDLFAKARKFQESVMSLSSSPSP